MSISIREGGSGSSEADNTPFPLTAQKYNDGTELLQYSETSSGFSSVDDKKSCDAVKRRNRSRTSSTIPLIDIDALQQKIMENGSNESEMKKKNGGTEMKKFATGIPKLNLNILSSSNENSDNNNDNQTNDNNNNNNSNGNEGSNIIHVGIPKANAASSPSSISPTPITRKSSIASVKQALLNGARSPRICQSPRVNTTSSPDGSITPRRRAMTLSESLRKLKENIVYKSSPEGDIYSPRNRMHSPKVYDYNFVKLQYSSWNSQDVIQAERKRMLDLHAFSPKVILEHLKQEGKLNPNWFQRCDIKYIERMRVI